MICAACSKLAYLNNIKPCLRCQGQVIVNIAVICEVCSTKDQLCSVCLKKTLPASARTGGCGCGKKR